MYTTGTIRSRHPRETLADIALYTPSLGISRCQNVTDFDRIGIPVFCAVTPQNPVLQIAWGKGCTEDNARASALMEAVERSFLEEPHPHEQVTSYSELVHAGNGVLSVTDLPTFNRGVYYNPKRKIAWVPMYDFLQHSTSWVPASAIYYTRPMLSSFTANGLASGNSPEEAMLHGIFEVFERHAVSSMFVDGKLQMKKSGGTRVPLTGFMSNVVDDVLGRLKLSSVELILFSIPCDVETISVYWAVLHDPVTPYKHIAISMGYGAHSSPEVAILRAVTEAAQSRVTNLHGCREDKCHKISNPPSQNAIDRTIGHFKSVPEGTRLGDMPTYTPMDFTNELSKQFSAVRKAGYDSVLSLEIPHNIPNISIRKTLIPNTIINSKLF